MTRAFLIVLTIDGSPWSCIRTYAPEHAPSDVPADEVIGLLTPALGKTLTAMSSGARLYLLDDIADDPQPALSSVLVSAAEL